MPGIDKDTGFNPKHRWVHVKSYDSEVHEYMCPICGAVFIYDWGQRVGIFTNKGEMDRHDIDIKPEPMPDPAWVEGIEW